MATLPTLPDDSGAYVELATWVAEVQQYLIDGPPNEHGNEAHSSVFITAAEAPVQSVNGSTGNVVLEASDVGAYPASNPDGFVQDDDSRLTDARTPTSHGNEAHSSIFITAAEAPVQSVNGETGDVVLNVEGVPTGGTTGQLLAKASTDDYDTSWVDPAAGGGDVESVNGQTGAVILDAADVDAYPASNPDGFVDAAGATAAAPVQSVNGQTGEVILSVDGLPTGGSTGQVLAKISNQDYDTGWVTASGSGNVDSVNGQTGTVVLDAEDVGAYPASNPEGFVDAAGAAAAAPVQDSDSRLTDERTPTDGSVTGAKMASGIALWWVDAGGDAATARPAGAAATDIVIWTNTPSQPQNMGERDLWEGES